MSPKGNAAVLLATLAAIVVGFGIPQTASAATSCGMLAPFHEVSTTASCRTTFVGNPVRVEGAIVGALHGPACIEGPLCVPLTIVEVKVFAPSDPSAGSVSCSNVIVTVAGVCLKQGRLTGLRLGTALTCTATFFNASQPANRMGLGVYRCSSGATSL